MKNKFLRILITGGTGFLGSHLVEHFSTIKKYKVFFTGRNILKGKNLSLKTKSFFYPLSLENAQNVNDVLFSVKPDIIVHCAALKYADFAEKHPIECVNSNILGSQNLLMAAKHNKCSKLIIISSDKASPPFNNIYGMSKALMEKIFILDNHEKKLDLCIIRFGNLAWSSGSVLPIWKKMKEEKNLILTTGPKMTRFFYQVDLACKVIFFAINNIRKFKNKILIPETKSVKIENLLREFSKVNNVKWKVVKKRAIDKDFEKLISEQEYPNTYQISTKIGKIYVLKNSNSIALSKKSIDSRFSKKFSSRELKEIIKNIK